MTAAAGLRFRHDNGAYGQKLLPETLGSGCAFLDADGDGWLDILLSIRRTGPAGRVASRRFPRSTETIATARSRTSRVRQALPSRCTEWASTAADYDNDGDVDIYVTALGPNRLFQNVGGRFVDVTAKAGVGDPGFSTSAMWFDYDRDGRLDLYVANYVAWSIEKDLFCTLDGKTKSYCTPESYTGQSGTLYRNRGEWHVRGRHAQSGPVGSRRKGAGRRPDRLQRRQPARSGRCERYPAESPLSQQRRRNVHRCRTDGGHRVQRGRRCARGHGRRCRRLRRLRPARAS